MNEPKIRLRRIRPYREIRCSADVLKWLGFACVCLGTFSTAVVQRAIIQLDSHSTETLYAALEPGGNMMGWASLAVVTMLLSAVAIPVYAKLVYEGWLHTSNQKKYLTRLLVLALVSEVFYDWAMRGKLVDLSVQNPVWSLAIAVVMLSIFRQYDRSVPVKVLVCVAALAWTVLLQSYMGALTVLLVAGFYFLSKKKKGWSTAYGAVLSLVQFPAPFGMFFVHWYDGRKGETPRKLFYILYPLQLLVFGLIAALI